MVFYFDTYALKKWYCSDYLCNELKGLEDHQAKWYISAVSEREFYIWLNLKGLPLKDFEERFITVDINPEFEAARIGWRGFFEHIFAKMDVNNIRNFREAIEIFFLEILMGNKGVTKNQLIFVTNEQEIDLWLSYNGFRSYLIR